MVGMSFPTGCFLKKQVVQVNAGHGVSTPRLLCYSMTIGLPAIDTVQAPILLEAKAMARTRFLSPCSPECQTPIHHTEVSDRGARAVKRVPKVERRSRCHHSAVFPAQVTAAQSAKRTLKTSDDTTSPLCRVALSQRGDSRTAFRGHIIYSSITSSSWSRVCRTCRRVNEMVVALQCLRCSHLEFLVC